MYFRSEASSISSHMADPIIKLSAPIDEKQNSHKVLEKVNELRGKETAQERLKRLVIRSNLLKHQNWMYKECTEHLIK